MREALADWHRAQTEYGHDSREAKIAHQFFVDIFNAANSKPKHYCEQTEAHPSHIPHAALDALNNLEELREIAHMEKFGTTDFEIGEGFLERSIGKEDPDTNGLWP